MQETKVGKEFIIVGVDPGTTTGVVSLDLDGNIVDIESRRYFSKAEIISHILDMGIPLVIASDMSPPPKKVEKVAAALPTRLFYPDAALGRREKAEAVRDVQREWRNQHEKDAAAAAIFAYKKFAPILKKVKKRLEREDLPYMRGDVSRDVILRDRNIKAVIRDMLKSKRE